MSYVAIARKWRPTSFAEIAGQGHVTRTLQNAIQLGRVHHAFLFTGARGVGKTTAARVLARALNCAKGPTSEPCGDCSSCVAIGLGNSPDVIEIDGASNNSVEDVRDLRDSVRYLPQQGRKKVYIVDEVHMLSRGAFNALLKTLEEPPDHVVFIFATTEPHKIPDTILSRIQRFDFKRMPVPVVAARLKEVCEGEGYGITDDGLRLIARAGEGSMRDSQSLLDRVVSFAGATVSTEQVAEVLGLVDRNLLYGMLEGMLSGEADKCLEAIDSVHGFGYDLSEFTSELLELLRNATMVGLSKSSHRYIDVSEDERERLGAMAEDVAPEVLVRSFEVMLDVHERVARAPRPRMVLEMAVARLVSIRPARPVDQIVQRIGDLERRLRGSGPGPRPRTPSRPTPAGRTADDDGEPARAPSMPMGSPRASAAPAVRPYRAPEVRMVADEDEAPLPQRPMFLLAEVAPLGADDVAPEPMPLATPAPLARDAGLAARFEALQRWLELSGPRYEVWAWDTFLISAEDGVLRVGAPSAFKARNVGALPASDPVLAAGLRAYLPLCNRVEPTTRDDRNPGATRRERAAEARAVLVKALRSDVEQDPLVMKIMTGFGAKIAAVAPADERPAVLGRNGDGAR